MVGVGDTLGRSALFFGDVLADGLRKLARADAASWKSSWIAWPRGLSRTMNRLAAKGPSIGIPKLNSAQRSHCLAASGSKLH